MHLQTTIAALLVLASASAHALSVDAKALARYDISYVQCEAKFSAMRGRRDEAYLSLWQVKADGKALADLAAARKSKAYLSERQRVLQANAKGAAPAASSPLDQQCQALWGEAMRNERTKK